MKILIIEDDRDTAGYLVKRLQEKCFAVDVAYDGNAGAAMARSTDYDLVLLDHALPEKNGIGVAQDIRTQPEKHRKSVPIIMISVTHDVEHKVRALEIGIDDYISKPFFFDELLARMHAVLRRPGDINTQTMRLDDLVLDIATQKVTRGTSAVYLTKKEFALLEYLMKNKGSVVSRGAITEHVWDMNIDPISNTIEMHILNLRKKLEPSRKRKLIHSIPGRGYKLDLDR